MFDRFFRPVCPCDLGAKMWIERRLRWLSEQFEDSAIAGRPVVTPTPEFLGECFTPGPLDIRRVLDRVCELMDVSPGRVELRMIEDDGDSLMLVNDRGQSLPGSPAGLYEAGGDRTVIHIHRHETHDPVALIGTIAHELAHERLLGEERLCGDEFDNELLTDLTVVYLGLGIFLANCPRNWESQNSKWPGTGLVRPEYMSPPMFGYALAHIAWHRGEKQPPWARYLDWGPRSNLKQGIRYLLKTGDSTFKPWFTQMGFEA